MLVHLGDYRYTRIKCTELTCKDNFQNWLFEFFLPFLPIFKKMPVLLIRGNHETCSEFGPGYFLLIHHENDISCDNERKHLYTKPFFINLDMHHKIIVFDSSNASDHPALHVADFEENKKKLYSFIEKGQKVTLLTHKPIYCMRGKKNKHLFNKTLWKVNRNFKI
jgi:hypothetical protein